jgi:type II secretory pathway component PulM
MRKRGPSIGGGAKLEEQEAAAKLQTAARTKGLKDARIRALGKRGGAQVRIDRVPLAKVNVLCEVLCGGKKRK